MPPGRPRHSAERTVELKSSCVLPQAVGVAIRSSAARGPDARPAIPAFFSNLRVLLEPSRSLTLAHRLIRQPDGRKLVPTSHSGAETDKERRPPDDPADEVPETPPDAPQPAPVQDPPAEPTTVPYVVSRADGGTDMGVMR